MGNIGREWQDTDSVFSYFGDERKNCIESYEKFVLGDVTEGKRPDLVGGGLLRSSGGWSAVLSLRRKGRRVAYDERILAAVNSYKDFFLKPRRRKSRVFV